MEETTTDAATQAQAPDTAQPDEQPAEAVTTPDSEPTSPEGEQPEQSAEPEEPSEDGQQDNSAEDDLADYWSKKGIDITTPEGQRAAAKSYREAEKAMHQSKQRSSELEKQLQGTPYEKVSDDPVAQRALETAASVQLELQVERWKQANSVTPEQDVAIGQYLTEHQDKAYLLKNGYLSLDDVAAMSGAFKQDTDAIKTQASRDTLENLANKQTVTAPKGNATRVAAPPQGDPILDVLRSDD